ncbi:MAG: twin-arginine translocase subunit TatC, partial [Candidatus Eremiobacteraeota bacterium]|nr:twin-arginine translocase subunit TatC [Candidatus Eremiobacteraeota bacterium]
RIGIVSAAFLQKYRRHAIFGFFVLGGIAAPDGNPLTMAMLAIPMYVLFEVSIWVIIVLEKSWKRQT